MIKLCISYFLRLKLQLKNKGNILTKNIKLNYKKLKVK